MLTKLERDGSKMLDSEWTATGASSRRRFVIRMAGGAAVMAWLDGCGGAEVAARDAAGGGDNADSGNTTGGSAGDGSSVEPACTVYPQQTAGPFYLNEDLVRRDITEGKPGVPLALSLHVLRASDCAPLEGLAVDLWQCDAEGVYSGFPGQLGDQDTSGETFLRGTQITDANGRVVFDTIYPGWYPGRTTHIHFRVHTSETTSATSQLYFPEDVSTAIYATEFYAARGQKDTTNAADGVTQAEVPPLVEVIETDGGFTGALSVHVVTA